MSDEVAIPWDRPVHEWTEEPLAAYRENREQHTKKIAGSLVFSWEHDYGPVMAQVAEQAGLNRTEAMLFWLITKLDHTHKQTDGIIGALNRGADITSDFQAWSKRTIVGEMGDDEPWKEADE